MVQSIWRRGFACILGVGLSACATVPVGSKSYVVRAEFEGGQGSKHDESGPDVPSALKKTGVLLQGGKIAVLPEYKCDTKTNEDCYAEIDKLERSLSDAGFWVEHWRELVTDKTQVRYDELKARGIEHAVFVADYRLQSGKPDYLKVHEIFFFEQREAKKPRSLDIKPNEWKVLRPRCIQYFENSLAKHRSAARGEIAVRLISVPEQRVIWAHRYQERGADRVDDLQIFHDLPKQVRNNKSQRYWGIGMAATGLALGVGAGVGARRMSVGSAILLAGVGLISAGLGGWLIYDSRPREVHELGPTDVLCNPTYIGAQTNDAQKASSHFVVSSNSQVLSASDQAKVIENSLVKVVTEKLNSMRRLEWAKPKKKKKKKEKKASKPDDRVSALSCRWVKSELRCKAACTRCLDPWEGPCEICHPPKLPKFPNHPKFELSGWTYERAVALGAAWNVEVIIINEGLKPAAKSEGKKKKPAKADSKQAQRDQVQASKVSDPAKDSSKKSVEGKAEPVEEPVKAPEKQGAEKPAENKADSSVKDKSASPSGDGPDKSGKGEASKKPDSKPEGESKQKSEQKRDSKASETKKADADAESQNETDKSAKQEDEAAASKTEKSKKKSKSSKKKKKSSSGKKKKQDKASSDDE